MNEENYRPEYADSAALIIGINDYTHVSPLEIARSDAESIAAALTGGLGFPQEKVITLLDGTATRAEIMKQFLSFESLAPDSRLLVFFAGHGHTEDARRGPVGFLVPVDGRPDDKSTLIRWQELTQNAELIPAKHILFIMDACYSGLAIRRASGPGDRRFLREMLQRDSRQVITAGKSDQTVADGGGPSGKNSIFTGHLLEGLSGKAANESGIITASHLMDYVYRNVSTDPRSDQTPHFGHLDGEGDFILRTPNNEHLAGSASVDFLIKPILERPEQTLETQTITIKPKFAEKNGYTDPDSEKFGRNDWTEKLAMFQSSGMGGSKRIDAVCWLSLIVEPVSATAPNLDIQAMAKALPNRPPRGTKPHEQFRMPSQSRTTSRSLILYEPFPQREESETERWRRFIRIEKSGAIEYCESSAVSCLWSSNGGKAWFKVFKYVQTIGTIWNFLFAAKTILDSANYHAGSRFLVNLIGTKDSMLFQFSSRPGKDNKHWLDPFDSDAIFNGSTTNWRCHDLNLQIPFQLVMNSLDEAEARKVIAECAEMLGLAYNHQSAPRCFNFGTDEFPWELYDPYNR